MSLHNIIHPSIRVPWDHVDQTYDIDILLLFSYPLYFVESYIIFEGICPIGPHDPIEHY